MKKLLIVLFLTYGHEIFARCNFRVRANNFTGNYSMLTDPTTLSVRMRRQGNNISSFFCYLYSYGFSTGNASDYNRYLISNNGDQLSYNLYKATDFQNILKEIDDVSQNAEAIFGYVLSSNTWISNSFDLRVSIDNSVLVPSGTYEDNVTVKLYSGFPYNSPVLERSTNLRIRITVDPEINISLVATGGDHDPASTTYNMDFGELQTGESMGADLKVVANTPHKVYFESENRGEMVNSSPSSSSTIAYTLSVSGNSVNLNAGSPRKVVDQNGITSVTGDTYPINVTIGSTTNKDTGSYSDSITITAEAN